MAGVKSSSFHSYTRSVWTQEGMQNKSISEQQYITYSIFPLRDVMVVESRSVCRVNSQISVTVQNNHNQIHIEHNHWALITYQKCLIMVWFWCFFCKSNKKTAPCIIWRMEVKRNTTAPPCGQITDLIRGTEHHWRITPITKVYKCLISVCMQELYIWWYKKTCLCREERRAY